MNTLVIQDHIFFPELYWDIIHTQHCISLKCTLCLFDTPIYCKTITTVAIANTSIITIMSLSYVCVEPAQFFFGDNVTASCFSPKNMQ